MRNSGDTGHARAERLVGLSGMSLIAIVVLAGGAAAGSRQRYETRCMAVAGDGVSIKSVDGCLAAGSHIRVEAQVMQGAGSLTGGLPPSIFSNDGPAPAGMRSDSPTRMRMGPPPVGRIYAR